MRKTFIQENAFYNTIFKMSASLFRPQNVRTYPGFPELLSSGDRSITPSSDVHLQTSVFVQLVTDSTRPITIIHIVNVSSKVRHLPYSVPMVLQKRKESISPQCLLPTELYKQNKTWCKWLGAQWWLQHVKEKNIDLKCGHYQAYQCIRIIELISVLYHT